MRKVPLEAVPLPTPEWPPRRRTMEPPVTGWVAFPRVRLPPVIVRVQPLKKRSPTAKLNDPLALPRVVALPAKAT